MAQETRILGIETSCDETAAAVVEGGRRILSNLVASQAAKHADYGGVFPEVASRMHIEAIHPIVARTLSNSHVGLESIDAIAVTTHGATAALLSDTGELALPVLDYEYAGPEQVAADYDAIRPSFRETGSPRLPIGLNLGAQIFWQARAFPREFARVASIVM